MSSHHGISTEKTYGNSGSIRETEKLCGKVVYGEVVPMFHLDISGYIWIVIFPTLLSIMGVSCAGKGMPWVAGRSFHLRSVPELGPLFSSQFISSFLARHMPLIP